MEDHEMENAIQLIALNVTEMIGAQFEMADTALRLNGSLNCSERIESEFIYEKGEEAFNNIIVPAVTQALAWMDYPADSPTFIEDLIEQMYKDWKGILDDLAFDMVVAYGMTES